MSNNDFLSVPPSVRRRLQQRTTSLIETSTDRADDAFSGTRPPMVSILVVAYKSLAFIDTCLTSVIKHTRTDYEILLIDNGGDGTEAHVKALFPKVRIVPSQGNIGFGPANNVLAAQAKGRLLLLLNPDTQLIDPAIDRLVEFAQEKNAGAWGGVTTYPDGRLDAGNYLELPTVWGILRNAIMPTKAGRRQSNQELPKAPKQVSVLCGGFMMVSREAWDAVGGFDPTFLLYSEETDLFTRLRRAGYKAWVTPFSRIIHDVGSGNQLSARRTLFLFTGQMHYARRHWRAPVTQLVGAAYWLLAVRRWTVGAVLGITSAEHRNRRRAYNAIVFTPAKWWRGYEGRTRLD